MPAQPDYRRIADDLESRIDTGQLAPGDRLPTIEDLAAEYDTSISTIKMVLVWLEARGRITRRQGKGIYVA